MRRYTAVEKYSFVFQIKMLFAIGNAHPPTRMQFLTRVSMQSKEFRIIWGSRLRHAVTIEKSTLSILKIVKCSECTSMHDLVLSPKCTFLRPKCDETNVNIEKTLASATCFDSNAPHIFSYSSKIYTYKYKYCNVQLLKIT